MRRRVPGIWLAVLLIVLFAAMPLWQLADWLSAKREKEQTVALLYQVAVFQMEMMGSTVSGTGRVTGTSDLETWKRAVYSAAFAHERLATALNGSVTGKLEGLEALMQWIARVQVGSGRPLAKDESELLQSVAPLCAKLVSAYGKLLDDEANVSGRESGELKKTDAELAEMVKKKLK